MENVFFAILPDARAATHIGRLQDDHGLPGSPVEPAHLHVSLHWVGDDKTPVSIIQEACEAVHTLDMPCFRVAFDRALSFHKAGRIVLAGGDELVGLMVLRKLIGERLNAPAKADFTPHLTFLYSDRRIPEISIKPISWIVRDLVLVRSAQGCHTLLAPLPLRKGPIG